MHICKLLIQRNTTQDSKNSFQITFLQCINQSIKIPKYLIKQMLKQLILTVLFISITCRLSAPIYTGTVKPDPDFNKILCWNSVGMVTKSSICDNGYYYCNDLIKSYGTDINCQKIDIMSSAKSSPPGALTHVRKVFCINQKGRYTDSASCQGDACPEMILNYDRTCFKIDTTGS